MGFTWEHDAHIHLRRATTLRQLVGGAPLCGVHVQRRHLDPGDPPAALVGHRLMVLGFVGDPSAGLGLLDPADAMLEARRPGHRPGPRPVGVARVGLERLVPVGDRKIKGPAIGASLPSGNDGSREFGGG